MARLPPGSAAARIRRALNPGEQVVTGLAEGAEMLITEARRLQRYPEHGVEQVVLAVPHLASGQAGPGWTLDEHAAPVGQERHERDPPHLIGRRIGADQVQRHVDPPPGWSATVTPTPASWSRIWSDRAKSFAARAAFRSAMRVCTSSSLMATSVRLRSRSAGERSAT